MSTIADRITSTTYISMIWSHVVTWGWTCVATIIIATIIYRLLRPSQHNHHNNHHQQRHQHNQPSTIRVTAAAGVGPNGTRTATIAQRRNNNNESSSSTSASSSSSNGNNGSTLSSRYSIALTSHYDHNPSFVTASLAAAIDEAKLQNQMLAIYLAPSATSPQDDAFCRNTLCTEMVSNVLKVNFTCWAGVFGAPESLPLARALHVTAAPFICLLSIPTSGPHRNQLVLVLRHEGPISAGDLFVRLVEAIDKRDQLINQHNQVQAARDASQNLTRQLIQEQDREYQTALRQDEERVRRERENEEAKAREAKIAADMAAAEADRQAAIAHEKDRAAEVRATKLSLLPHEPPAGHDVISVRLRLPNGARDDRRFVNTDTMMVIFNWIESHELLTVDGDDIMPIIDRSYRVLTTHPRRYYGAAHIHSSLASLSLPRQCLLTVEQSDHDDTNVNDNGHDGNQPSQSS